MKKPYRPKIKREVLDMLIKGESIEKVEKVTKIPFELIEKWSEAYHAAGAQALRYTGDDGETPGLNDLQRTAQKAFPTRLLHGCDSAASFFCAQFYGRNDVVNLYNAGIPEVTLIDLDEEKLMVMKEMYPTNWNYVLGDAFEKANEFAEKGKKFDCVICDPYSSFSSKVAWDEFNLFSKIASKYLFLLYTQKMFDAMGVDSESPDVAEKIAIKTGCPVDLVGIFKRSSHAGGIYWCVFRIA